MMMSEADIQTSFEDYEKINNPADDMSERERISFIREKGTEAMKKGMEAVFDGNKWKPKREDMWKNRLNRGKRMVRTILEKED